MPTRSRATGPPSRRPATRAASCCAAAKCSREREISSNPRWFGHRPTCDRRHRTFAPILYLIGYDTLEEAVALQNAVPYGLSSALFTDRLQRRSGSCRRGQRLRNRQREPGHSGAEIAEPSAARRTRAAVARPDRIPGKPICGGKPRPSTGARSCRWHKASNSTCEPGLDLRGPRAEACRGHGPWVRSSCA